MSEQFYLVKISAMNTCDECDVVPSAEFIVDKDFSTNTAPILEVLPKLVNQFQKITTNASFTNLRPMTRDEIEAYRHPEPDDDELFEDEE